MNECLEKLINEISVVLLWVWLPKFISERKLGVSMLGKLLVIYYVCVYIFIYVLEGRKCACKFTQTYICF